MARGVSVAVEDSRLPRTAAGQRRVSGRSPAPAIRAATAPTASAGRAPGARSAARSACADRCTPPSWPPPDRAPRHAPGESRTTRPDSRRKQKVTGPAVVRPGVFARSCDTGGVSECACVRGDGRPATPPVGRRPRRGRASGCARWSSAPATRSSPTVRAEVAEYALSMDGEFGRRIRLGVSVALDQFLDLLGTDDALPDTTRLLRARPRRAPPRPHHGRPAERLPHRLAGDVAPHRGARSDDYGLDAGVDLPARRGPVRLHRAARRGVGLGLRLRAVARRRVTPGAPARPGRAPVPHARPRGRRARGARPRGGLVGARSRSPRW